MEIKTLDASKNEFMANGHKYTISNKISIRRYAEHQKLGLKLAYGYDISEFFKNLKNAYNHLNNQKFADSAIIIHNLMNGISKVEESTRIHPGLKMAALFINREGENTAEYDENLINEKIEDWTKEGYDPSDFFTLALSSISGFREIFQESIQKNETLNA